MILPDAGHRYPARQISHFQILPYGEAGQLQDSLLSAQQDDQQMLPVADHRGQRVQAEQQVRLSPYTSLVRHHLHCNAAESSHLFSGSTSHRQFH